ncbi:MAG: hypothetical protein ACFE95_14695 [Candidatus Hodarchaeota archaeon]
MFTIAARDRKFSKNRDFLEEYIEITKSYSQLSFCVVAGHPVYPSIDVQMPVSLVINAILAQIRKKTDKMLFLGVENLTSRFVRQIRRNYDKIVPFLLHGDSRAIYTNGILPPFAIYSPISLTAPFEGVIKKISAYLLRRTSTQKELLRKGYKPMTLSNKWEELTPDVQSILRQSFHNHVLNTKNFQSRIHAFIKQGAYLIVGNPVDPLYFDDLVKNFNLNQVQLIS